MKKYNFGGKKMLLQIYPFLSSIKGMATLLILYSRAINSISHHSLSLFEFLTLRSIFLYRYTRNPRIIAGQNQIRRIKFCVPVLKNGLIYHPCYVLNIILTLNLNETLKLNIWFKNDPNLQICCCFNSFISRNDIKRSGNESHISPQDLITGSFMEN